ncbi:MAG: ABC transporter ATP-binding protein [Halobacteriales archaeon]|nr:ABC transporter ATP-binding protein [Halobacteriales archaeon]
MAAASVPALQPRATSASAPAIAVSGLRRTYGSKVALEAASFEVRQGEVFGFLGPNGAGKTTTIRILCGLLRASGGSASVLGFPAGPDGVEAKARLGYVPDEPAFPARVKALPLLLAYGRFYGMEPGAMGQRARELLGRVGLDGQEQRSLKTFSHGMKKRYALAQALLHDPPVLIMDEPSSGLDPAGTAWFRETIRGLRGQGKTVFLSSHILPEVQQVCDRVGIISQGKVLAVDSIEALGKRMQQRVEVVVVAEGVPEPALAALRRVPGVLGVRRDGDKLVVEAERDVGPEVNAALVQQGVRVRSLEANHPSLEDIYLAITGTAGTVGT